MRFIYIVIYGVRCKVICEIVCSGLGGPRSISTNTLLIKRVLYEIEHDEYLAPFPVITPAVLLYRCIAARGGDTENRREGRGREGKRREGREEERGPLW